MTKKIIFQDIDGPLIPFRLYFKGDRPLYQYSQGAFFYDPIAVLMLKELCEKCEAKVVFNTAHNENPAEIMKHQAVMNGMVDIMHEDIQTNYCKKEFPDLSRSDAIFRWLLNHPEVTDWVVIDDMLVHPTRQARVDFNIGMTMDTYQLAYRILMKEDAKRIMSVLGTYSH